MQQYTVVLLKPDYRTGEWSSNCHISHITADSSANAKKLAQIDAVKLDFADNGEPLNGNPEHYKVLCITNGLIELEKVVYEQ
jgi:hypothetical protein